MKHLALLASVYALIAAMVVPGSILAQEDPAEPAPPAETAAPAEPEQAPAEPAPAEPAPAAQAEPAEPAPAEPAPAPAEPEPQVLADERAEPSDSQPKARAAADTSVTVSDFTFSPGTVTIDQGDTVTWVNNGPTPHSATSSNGAFDTGIYPKGQSRSHTFNEAGTFAYICTPHPYMKGTVVVRASQAEGEGDSGAAGTGETGGAADTAQAAQDDGPSLPNSGADAAALLVLGGLMLLLGFAVRRRVAG
jgi:LPXTG-motif cell wall-anchored protein